MLKSCCCFCFFLGKSQSIILLNHVILCAASKEQLEAVADRSFYRKVKDLTAKDSFLLATAGETLALYQLMLEKAYGKKQQSMR